MQAIDKKRSKEAKELYNRIKPFARVMTAQDFEEFSKDILEELHCRARIQQLQEWRSNGLTTLEAGLKYERDKQARISSFEKFGASTAASLSEGNSRYRSNSANR